MLKIRFILMIVFGIALTLILANYVSLLLFDGNNSLRVYNMLKQQRKQLVYNISVLQEENARLQKEYFELKNLEPEE